MRVDIAEHRGEIELGVSIPSQENNPPEELESEIDAFREMAGVDLQDCVEAFVADERTHCSEANCCLQGLSARTSRHVDRWTDDRDTSFDFPTVTISVSCAKDGTTGTLECLERVESLTERLALFGQSAVQAKDEADMQASNLREGASDHAGSILHDAAERAETIKEKVETEVTYRRSKIFREARKDIEAPAMQEAERI